MNEYDANLGDAVLGTLELGGALVLVVSTVATGFAGTLQSSPVDGMFSDSPL